MNAIQRLKTPPMAVGLFLAGLLLFAVIGIARKATASIDAGSVAHAAQSNVGRVVRAVEVVDIQPATIPALGAVQTDPHGDKWVWLGRAWVACQHIDPATMTYNSIRTDQAITDWAVLATGDKEKVAEVCR
jgi:hypothetical protein